MADKSVDVRFNTSLLEIKKRSDDRLNENLKKRNGKNDLVFIFAGGELPTQFLMKAGINITTKFGEAILKHD